MKGKDKLIYHAKVKRQYAKILKQEGMAEGNDALSPSPYARSDSDHEDDIPASRRPTNNKRRASSSAKKEDAVSTDAAKPNPFKKVLEQAEWLRNEKSREIAEKARLGKQADKAKKQAKHKRAKQQTLFKKANDRGQPNMKSRIDLLLNRIQHEPSK
ncbi:hypothetical protein BC828DRAFT_387339 [Blastocladiella britannica]|nr:hypothetical protein BC828DRAFT_387339 [Blastocladiella britannica]